MSNTTQTIIGAVIEIHRRLGPGLLESAYEACLVYELEKSGLYVQRQKPVPLVYELSHCGVDAAIFLSSFALSPAANP